MATSSSITSGDLRVIKRIAVGGTAELMLVSRPGGDTAVLKRALQPNDPALRREGELLRALNHPNLIRCHAVMDDALLLEHVDGLDLAKLLSHLSKRGDALPVNAAIHLAHGVFQALRALHNAGHLHTDVAPGNILVDRSGAVKLIDLGLARPLGAPASLSAEGTLAYQAPEQLMLQALRPSADLYAAALVLYELITGTLARPAGAVGVSELRAARAAHLPAASTIRPGISNALDEPLHACLAPNQAQRPDSAKALLRLLPPSTETSSLVAAIKEVLGPTIPAARTAVASEQTTVPKPQETPTEVSARVSGASLDTHSTQLTQHTLLDRLDTRQFPSPLQSTQTVLEVTRESTPARTSPPRPSRAGWVALGLLLIPLTGLAALWIRDRAQAPQTPPSHALSSREPLRATARATPRAVSNEPQPKTQPKTPTPVLAKPRVIRPSTERKAASRIAEQRNKARRKRRGALREQPRAPEAPPVTQPPRIVVRSLGTALQISGAGPLGDEVSYVRIVHAQSKKRLLLRVEKQGSAALLNLGAPRGSYYEIQCGGRPKEHTPVLNLPLTGSLQCTLENQPPIRFQIQLVSS